MKVATAKLFSKIFSYRLLFSLLLIAMSLNSFADNNFLIKDTAGNKHQLSNFRGKWVLVNYWATWCPPCLEEVPDLVNLYDQRKTKDLMVLGVAFDYKTSQEVAAFADDMLMSYPIILGDESVKAQIGSAEVLPTTYIFDPQGRLVKIKRGLISRQYIESIIGPTRR